MPKKKKSVVTQASPKVTIGGTTYELTVTLKAIRAIDNGLGGIQPAFRMVKDRNITAITLIIVAAADLELKDQAALDDFTMAVWETDAVDVSTALSDYFLLLFAGGSAPDPDDEPAKDAAGNG